MQQQQDQDSPADEWLASLNATCNRFSTQYLQLIRSAASAPSSGAGEHDGRSDPRAGGGHMMYLHDPPPPPLAAHVAHSSLSCQLAADNLCVAASQLLSLIRTLRLSLLLMDADTIDVEQHQQVQQAQRDTQRALEQAARQMLELLQRRQT
ncbi:hypothetical protein MPSEU_000328400 [Mayamaea pseudoterrestris]|nr:hypothetical protein MPSEU_000328400 [Mayamaea pseudoterrestris]